MDPAKEGSHLFLSYSRDDADLVRRLSEAIEAQGWSTWVDRASIPSASEWMAEIRRGIEAADGFVYILTPSSLASRMCRVELSIAVDLSKRLLPVWVLDKTKWETAMNRVRERSGPNVVEEVPPELQKLDYVDINDFLDHGDPIEALVDELLTAASRDLAWLRRHTRLQQDVKRWLDGRYANAALLRGRLLSAAEEMLAAEGKDPPLTDLQCEFVEASRAEHRRTLEREARQLAHRVLDVPPERIALGIMLALEGLKTYLHTPQLEGALRTLLSRWPQLSLIRHERFPTGAAFSHDGMRVLTSSADGFLRWVAPRSGSILRQMGQRDVPIWKAVLSPNGKQAAAACADGHVRVFDLETGESTNFRVSENDVNDLAVSADGRTIVAVSGAVPIVIDLVLGHHYELPHHPGSIKSVAFHAETRVNTTCEDGQVRFFHLDTQRLEEFGLPDHHVNSVRVNPDGTWMAVSGSFNGVLVVDIETRSIKHQLDVPSGSALLIALSTDGERVAAADIFGRVLVFDPHRGELIANKNLFPSAAWDLAMSHDGALFCGASSTGLARVCQTSSDREWLCAGHDGAVGKVAFDPRGELLVTAGNDSTVRIFEIGRVPGTVIFPHADTVISVDLSPDGALVVTTARDQVMRTFEVETGAQLAEYTRPKGTLVSATLTSADEVVVAFEDGRIAFVNARSGAETRSFVSLPIEANSEVRMTRDQRWLVVCLFMEIVRVSGSEDGTVVEAMDEQKREEIALDIREQMGAVSPGGRIVEGEDGRPPLLEREGTTIYLKTPEHQVIHGGFAPDGSVMVGAALNRKELPIFDSSDGELIATLGLGHQANHARFSADGTRIVASWLNAVSVVRYPNAARLLELAGDQVYRKLTAEERAEFGLPIKGEEAGGDGDERSTDCPSPEELGQMGA